MSAEPRDVEAVVHILSERMSRGASGRLIADYGVTILSLATEIAEHIAAPASRPAPYRIPPVQPDEDGAR